MHVHSNSIEATVNNILREWRDLWPGGLDERRYSTLNLLAHCREGSLGFNVARCGKCGHSEWYPSSCGDRHCPNCLGPRQAQWAEQVCGRLPDCPHFHVVFTLPEQLHELFAGNYRHLGNRGQGTNSGFRQRRGAIPFRHIDQVPGDKFPRTGD